MKPKILQVRVNRILSGRSDWQVRLWVVPADECTPATPHGLPGSCEKHRSRGRTTPSPPPQSKSAKSELLRGFPA